MHRLALLFFTQLQTFRTSFVVDSDTGRFTVFNGNWNALYLKHLSVVQAFITFHLIKNKNKMKICEMCWVIRSLWNSKFVGVILVYACKTALYEQYKTCTTYEPNENHSMVRLIMDILTSEITVSRNENQAIWVYDDKVSKWSKIKS